MTCGTVPGTVQPLPPPPPPPPRSTSYCLSDVGKPYGEYVPYCAVELSEESRTFLSGYRSCVDFPNPRVGVIETAICESQIS